MATEPLLLALAGNVPYYDPDTYQDPSLLTRLKRNLIDYRCVDYNQPAGKGAHFLLHGLQAFYQSGGSEVLLRMWGNVDGRYQDEVDELGLTDAVQISGFIPKEDSMNMLVSCDVMVLTLALGVGDHPPFSLPGKMFDYFKVGKPILALVEESYCAEVIRDSGLGTVVDPRDKKGIAEALNELKIKKRELGDRFKLTRGFEDRFSKEAMVNSMADLFDTLLIEQ